MRKRFTRWIIQTAVLWAAQRIARKIVEKMHGVNLRDWYREKGRHAVYARGKEVDLSTTGMEKSRVEARHFEQVVPREGPIMAPNPLEPTPAD